MKQQSLIAGYLQEVSQLVRQLSTAEVSAAVDLLFSAWQRQARVYVCGNGGSAAIASHFAGDLNKGANIAGRHRFRAHALVDNVPAMMAWSNDEGYERNMVEQLRNFIEPGDLVIGISGSGNSANVIRTMELANQIGAATLGFCGFGGGRLREISQVQVLVSSHNMEQVEDAFSVICHALLFSLRRRIRQEPPSINPQLASQVDAYQE